MEEKTSFQGKVPPHNTDAEVYLIASLLLDPGSIENIMMLKLSAEDFYDTRHQHLYRAVNDLHSKGMPIDAVTLTASLHPPLPQQPSPAKGTEALASPIERPRVARP